MKTIYFLFGGATRKHYSKTKECFKECLNIPKDEINFLLVYFAKDEGRWEECKQRDIDVIAPLTDKKINFVVADVENFENEVKKADVIYLQGGDTLKIKQSLHGFDLQKLFEGKVVMGNSAGVYVLAKYYYDNDYKKIDDGLAVLSIKAVCHYTEDIEDKLEELKQHNENLRVVVLPEGEYIRIDM